MKTQSKQQGEKRNFFSSLADEDVCVLTHGSNGFSFFGFFPF